MTSTSYPLLRKVSKAWYVARCWARYLVLGSRTGVPGLVEFTLGNHFFRARQEAPELIALGEILAARRLRCALEIGTFLGGTLLFLTRLASKSATIVTVDLPGGKFGGGYGGLRGWLYRRLARRGQRLHVLQGDSHSGEMLERIRGALGGQTLDFLFIDGDHSYEGVKCDFVAYGPFVGRGGLVAFHDIVEGPTEHVGGVPRFWQEIKGQYRHKEIVNNPTQGGAGIGVLYID